MSEYSDPAGRRKFLKLVGGTFALVPLAGLSGCGGGDDDAPAAAGGGSAGGGNDTRGYGGTDTAGDTRMAAENTQSGQQAGQQQAGQQAGQQNPGQTGQQAGGGGGDLPRLSLDDPQAKSLGYVHDATEVDQSKYARYQPGQVCGNCALWQGGDAEWGRCSIFPGKLVNTAGWCSAYAPKG